MTDKKKPIPISFVAPMVRAVRADLKTQTRRVVNPQPEFVVEETDNSTRCYHKWHGNPVDRDKFFAACPYGLTGTMLYVKEGFQVLGRAGPMSLYVRYLADDHKTKVNMTQHEMALWLDRKYPLRATPGRFMYLSLARDFLVNTGVGVERVQEISVEDCRAEGVGVDLRDEGWRYAFGSLWDSINAKRGYPWESNPWVWAVTFERIPACTP